MKHTFPDPSSGPRKQKLCGQTQSLSTHSLHSQVILSTLKFGEGCSKDTVTTARWGLRPFQGEMMSGICFKILCRGRNGCRCVLTAHGRTKPGDRHRRGHYTNLFLKHSIHFHSQKLKCTSTDTPCPWLSTAPGGQAQALSPTNCADTPASAHPVLQSTASTLEGISVATLFPHGTSDTTPPGKPSLAQRLEPCLSGLNPPALPLSLLPGSDLTPGRACAHGSPWFSVRD